MTETVAIERPPGAKPVSHPRSRKPATVSASALALHLDCSRTYINRIVMAISTSTTSIKCHVWTAPAVQEESDISAKRSGAAMYPAFECSRYGRWP